MERKGVKRTKKRKFCGNKYTPTVRPKEVSSTSSKKLKMDLNVSIDSDKVRPSSKCSPWYSGTYKDITGYRLVDVEQLDHAVKSSVNCKLCGGDVYLVETEVKGLGSKLILQCRLCELNSGSFYTSKRLENKNNS